MILWGAAALLAGGGLWLERVLAPGAAPVDLSGQSSAPRAEMPSPLPEKDIWARPGMEELSAELRQYQLAGTFLTYAFLTGDDADPQSALALVDDLREKRQVMLREQEALGSFTVARIGVDQLTLEREGQTWVLSLPGVLARRSTAVEPVPPPVAGPTRFEDMPALETTAYGKRIADNQWVIERQAIEAYAGDVMRDPRRIVELYQSFRQTASAEEERSGFRLEMKGEREFLGAMGLGDGDVIRKVNSMEMKNQARAEYLVREFMKSRMSAVVLDIEREGREEKLIYIIR